LGVESLVREGLEALTTGMSRKIRQKIALLPDVRVELRRATVE